MAGKQSTAEREEAIAYRLIGWGFVLNRSCLRNDLTPYTIVSEPELTLEQAESYADQLDKGAQT